MAKFTAAWAALALALTPVTLAAQDKDEWTPGAEGTGDMADITGFLGNGIFAEPEPLTPEQQARLPLAQALADKVLPAGSLSAAAGGFMQGIGSFIPLDQEPSAHDVVSRRIGGYMLGSELSDENAQRVATLLDPHWQERAQRDRQAFQQSMARMMETMEPAIRQAIAELYAVHFTEAELRDIDAFFATPSGAAYARQSYAMSSDPRLTGTMMRVLPQMFAQMEAIEAEAASATADLPPERNFADLSTNDRKLLARLLGLAVEDLEYALSNPAYLAE